MSILRRNVVHADTEVSVVDLAVLDQLIGGGAHDLRGNCESCARERAAIGDDEGVDANQLAVCVDQRAARVAGIDCGIGLDKVARLARVVRVRIRPVDGAHNSARD